METAIHLQKLQKYMQKHDGLPSVSALPFVFNLPQQETLAVIESLVAGRQLSIKNDGEIEPGKKFVSAGAKLSAQAIPAGQPVDTADDLHDLLNIHAYLVPSGSQTIIIPISGNSMINAGINDGDLAVIDTEIQANPGDIVAAEIDGKFTLKRLSLHPDGSFQLTAENPDYPTLIPRSSLNIQGVLVGLARRY
jgi:hypothetical protein